MHGMTYIGRFLSNFKEFYNDINAATLTGAIDVIVVEQPDGTYNCSPFHVRFGKIGVLRSREKIVDVEINGEPRDIHMKLGESGEAFFVEELEGADENEIPEHLATSPIPVSDFENLYNSKGRRRNSINLGDNNSKPSLENQVNDYTKRRYTADSELDKNRERDFLKRQIGLGNIDICENSVDDISLSLQSNTNKLSSDDISKDNDISETIFKMDSLEMETSKSENTPRIEEFIKTPVKNDEPVSENKNGKKKRRRKSMLKKKNAQRKSTVTNSTELPAGDISDQNEIKTNDSATDRSSLDSNTSDPELKEMQKLEMESTSNSNRKKTIDPDFHFFSDTELTSGNADSRPNSPKHIESVQSDTEFEVKNRMKDDTEEDNGHRWAWGEFPSVSQTNSPTSEGADQKAQEEEHNSMLTSMFSFMKQNKHRRHNSSDGVYLADISSGAIDPEIAALYFTSSSQKKGVDADMDCESGNGPSLTQSPNSAEGSKSIDSDFDEQNKSAQTYMHDISLSLCGWNPEPTEDGFIRHVVAFSDLCNNPSLLESTNLVVRIRNKYYTWKVAAPIISSLMIYQRPLPQSTIEQLCSMHMPTSSIQDKEIKQEPRSSWWNWRRSRTSREATPALDNANVAGTATKIPENIEDTTSALEVDEHENKNVSISKYNLQAECENVESIIISDEPTSSSDKCRKTLRLSSKQIASLNLRDGMNEVEFSVTTAYQGTTRCKCHLYKWRWDDKIVISDIDGTITKSDVLGHILPIVGKDWAQSGVAQLFNKIKDNGYKLLYLSARAIGQSRITREYLKSIRQGDLYMPDGPILLNPTSLITAFHREVIEKKPEQFKISCMSDIRALFPLDSNPFYAGYGNRINDVWAYRAVGIPIVRIFTINPKGELKHELTQTFQSSYSNMSYIVDQLFPPLLEAANDYSQFIYWREPVQAFEDLLPPC